MAELAEQHTIGSSLRLPAPLAWLALSAGIALAHYVPWPARPLAAPLGVAAGGCVLCAIAMQRRRWRTALFAAAGALALLSGRAEQEAVFSRWRATLADTPVQILTGRVAGVAVPYYGRYAYVAWCDSVYAPGGGSALHKRMVRCISDESPTYGRRILLRGRFRPPRLPDAPGGFNEYRYFVSNGLWGQFDAQGQLVSVESAAWCYRAMGVVRQHVHATLALLPSPQRRSLLQAAILGEKTVDLELKQSFARAGISHLLAISGLHVGIVTAGLLSLLGLLPLSARTRNSAALLALWGYVLLIGPLPSLVRAAVMATLLLAAPVVQRRSDTLNALGLAGIAWLLWAPESLFTPGYQLSFAATLGIILAVRRAKGFLTEARLSMPPVAAAAASPALVSAAAFVATLPIMAYHFGAVSVFGLVANLVVVLIMTWTMWAAGAALALLPVSSAAAGAAARGADWLLGLIAGIAEWARAVPLLHLAPFSVPMLAGYAAVIAMMLMRRSTRAVRWALLVIVAAVAGQGAFVAMRRYFRPVEMVVIQSGLRDAMVAAAQPGGDAWIAVSGPAALQSKAAVGTLDSWLRHRGAGVSVVLGADTLAVREALATCSTLHRIRSTVFITPHELVFAPRCTLSVAPRPCIRGRAPLHAPLRETAASARWAVSIPRSGPARMRPTVPAPPSLLIR
jgi:ComEC/Rec2-related protein